MITHGLYLLPRTIGGNTFHVLGEDGRSLCGRTLLHGKRQRGLDTGEVCLKCMTAAKDHGYALPVGFVGGHALGTKAADRALYASARSAMKAARARV